ncbi:MAG: hypothetical protein HY717_19140 [Planctomycetes bacterium]|nr:hypothetical protein [Planctomycetota bacterium]
MKPLKLRIFQGMSVGLLSCWFFFLSGTTAWSQEAAKRFRAEDHLPMESLLHLHVPSGRKLLQALGGTLPGRVASDPEIHAALGKLPEQAVFFIRQYLGLVPGLEPGDLEKILNLFSGEVVLSITGLDPFSFVSAVLVVEPGAERQAALEMIERLEKGLAGGEEEPKKLEIGKRAARILKLPPRGIYYLELGNHLVFSLSPEVLKGMVEAFDRDPGDAGAARDFRLKDNEPFMAVSRQSAVEDPCLRLVVNIEAWRSLALMGLQQSPQGKEVVQVLEASGLASFTWLSYSLGARAGDIEGKLFLRASGKGRGAIGAVLEGISPPQGQEEVLSLLPGSARSLGALAIEPGRILQAFHRLAETGLPREIWSEVQQRVKTFEESSKASLKEDLFQLGKLNLFVAAVPPPGGGFFDDTFVFVKTKEFAPYFQLAQKLASAVGKEAVKIPEGGKEITYVRAGSVFTRLLGIDLENLELPQGLLAMLADPAISVAAAPVNDEWSVVSNAPQPILRYLRFHAKGARLAPDFELASRLKEVQGAALYEVFRPGKLFLTAYNTLVSAAVVYRPLYEAYVGELEVDAFKLPPGEKFMGSLKEGFVAMHISDGGIQLHGHRVFSAYAGVALLGVGIGGASAAIGFASSRSNQPVIQLDQEKEEDKKEEEGE